jgi:hypothetical protein
MAFPYDLLDLRIRKTFDAFNEAAIGHVELQPTAIRFPKVVGDRINPNEYQLIENRWRENDRLRGPCIRDQFQGSHVRQSVAEIKFKPRAWATSAIRVPLHTLFHS